MPFTSRPHCMLGVGYAFTPKVPKIDSTGAKTLAKVDSLPGSDEFSLAAQLKAGVPLKEVNSRLIGSSSVEVPHEKVSSSSKSSDSSDSTKTSEKVEVKSDSTSTNSSDKE